MSTSVFASEMIQFVREAADGCFRRFCPQDRLPRIAAGYQQYDRTDSALLLLYTRLLQLDIRELNGRSVAERMTELLGHLEGAKYETWWSA